MSDAAPVRHYLLGLQQGIVDAFAAIEAEAGGQRFLRDAWQRPPGGPLEGDGLSQLVEGGAVLERGGCNFSHVRGRALPPSATQHRGELAGAPFEALGGSVREAQARALAAVRQIRFDGAQWRNDIGHRAMKR